MSNEAKDKAFEQIWPKCFVIFMAIVELLAVILLFLTELGNVAANFWKTNVFAGGWGGLILLLHVIFLFVAGCCSPSCPAAFRAVILTLLALVASAAMVSFDVAFILRPDACLLTPDCLSNDRSNSSFADSFQESFLVTFRNIDMFKSYSESQIKLLFQAIQIGVAAVCFIICLIYLIVYFVHDKKATQHIASQAQQSSGEVRPPSQALGAPMNTGFYPAVAPPAPMNNLYPAIPPGYFPPRAVAPLPQNYYRQPPPQAWGALPHIPQPQPGEVPWNNGGRY